MGKEISLFQGMEWPADPLIDNDSDSVEDIPTKLQIVVALLDFSVYREHFHSILTPGSHFYLPLHSITSGCRKSLPILTRIRNCNSLRYGLLRL